MLAPIEEKGLEVSNDTKILACALAYDRDYHPDETIFVTNDLALKAFANLFFGEDCITSVVEEEQDNYTGYKVMYLNEEEQSELYTNLNENLHGLLINEYLVIKNKKTNETIDTLCWTGSEMRQLRYRDFDSRQFGRVKPMKNDTYQRLLFDSLFNNQITLVSGPPGSGKTFCALAYLFHLLEHGKIDKIIIFCNTVATKDSARLGFYPGDRDEKLLDSQIGNLLASKLGDKFIVEQMIADGKLILLPLSDIRGYDTSGMNAGVYISEAQNMSTALMKLVLQRIGEDSVCIIDGDRLAQIDDINYAGVNNGMKKASKVFRGEDMYGEVQLRHIHRSRIAKIAERI